MRKSPTIKERICNRCGIAYKPTGNAQRYCPTCKVINHHEAQKKYEQKRYPNRKPKVKCTEPCCVCGGIFSAHFNGNPYCNKHYQRMKLYGNPYGHPRERTNTYEIDGELLIITTAKGEKILADAEDYDRLSQHSWCVSKTGYAVANIRRRVVKLHRFLLNLTDQYQLIDHINHNTLDNRKKNLRICTQSQNAKNTSPVNGGLVSGIRQTRFGKYSVRITNDRKEVHVGTYSTLEEAVQARIEAERKYHGEFGYHDSVNRE